MDGAPHNPWRRRLGLLAILCVAIASGLVMQASGWAQTSNYSLVRALHGGTATIDQWHWETRDISWYKGHYYSVKSPILPALSLPVYAVIKAAGGEKLSYETAKNARLNGSWRWRPLSTPAGLYGANRIRTYHVRGQIEAQTHRVLSLVGRECYGPDDMMNAFAPVAQLDRATGFEPVGRGFESLRAHQ